ncbi:DUF4199 domain-containing protein [Pseudochryseolinea flava]|uniref:DUF4199 domain-containing protein n=1 Tax=Pseudochryseolinea flava TaxID=2059302 RepID=A0A364Y4L0_9BACT|nr:DUF4199 domain-containing protein [Pseudochryseolinea flava]RAW01882.1 DUF4199 domain-containing protein [Pseudochryseolinea flava]
MRKIILTYGAIAGAICVAMFCISIPMQQNGFMPPEKGMFVGYASMVIAFSMIFFGIKNYRDNHLNGVITFGKGFKVGILIAVVASLVYAISWEIYYAFLGDAFNEFWMSCQIDVLEKEGASSEAIEAKRAELAAQMDQYKNVFIRFPITLMEIFPVGLIVTLITAAVLRKREVLPA